MVMMMLMRGHHAAVGNSVHVMVRDIIRNWDRRLHLEFQRTGTASAWSDLVCRPANEGVGGWISSS